MAQADDQSGRKLSAVATWWATSGWTSLLMGAIAVASALVAFTAVRAWYVPVRATALAPANLTVAQQPLAESPIDAAPPAARAPGRTVSVLTDPPGARVVVDGRPRGVSPLVIDDLVAGEHTIGVASETGSAQRTVTVSNAVALEVMFSLPRSTAPVAGWLAVTSPFPVDVVEGSEVIGTSDTSKIMLAAGTHNLVLRNDGIGYSATRTIEIAPGRVASVHVTPPTGRLNVNAMPWADVLIDGRPAGQTPLGNVEIAIGPHQITFRHPQFGERTEQIVITAASMSRVSVDLTK